MPPSPNTTTTSEQTGNQTPADNSTLLGILAYLGPLVVVAHLMGKDDQFVTFHTKQGMVLFGIELSTYVLTSFMMYGFYFLMPILTLINLACLILTIIGIVHVVQKEQKPLPVVGSLAKHVPF